jgi:hypothetical protein
MDVAMGRFKDSIYQQHEGGLLDDESGELQDLQTATQEAPSDALKSFWRKPSGSTTPQVPKAFVIVDVEGRAEQAAAHRGTAGAAQEEVTDLNVDLTLACHLRKI